MFKNLTGKACLKKFGFDGTGPVSVQSFNNMVKTWFRELSKGSMKNLIKL